MDCKTAASYSGVLQLGAIFLQTCHFWSHREVSDPGTLSKYLHTWNARSWDQPRDEGLAVFLYEALLHRGKEAELLKSTLYFNLIL